MWWLRLLALVLVAWPRAAYAHGEQLLVNLGVAVFLVPSWSLIALGSCRRLQPDKRAWLGPSTLVAVLMGLAWAWFGSNVLADGNAYDGPPLSFAALSIAALPAAVALMRSGQRGRGLLLLGVPLLLGLSCRAVT